MAKTVIQVGNELLHGTTLLPTVRESFCTRSLISTTDLEGVKSVEKLVTSRWMLSNLTVSLQITVVFVMAQ